MQFSGLVTVDSKPAPVVNKAEKGTFIRVKVYSKTNRSYRYKDKDGTQKNGYRSGAFLEVWINNKADGSPSNFVKTWTTPGAQFYVTGDYYSTQGEDRWYDNFRVNDFQPARDSSEEEGTSAATSVSRPAREAPAASAVSVGQDEIDF